MTNYLTAKCRATRLTDLKDNFDITRFIGHIQPLDYDLNLEINKNYYFLGLIFFEKCTNFILFSDNWMLSSDPVDAFDIHSFPIPEGWMLRLNKLYPNARELAPERLLKNPYWFEEYLDDDPEVLALVDEIIQEIQDEEEAKNPKKDPFDEYWGL